LFNPRKLQFLLLKIVLLGNICAIIALIVRFKKELIMREDGRENDQIRRVKFTKGFTKHAPGSVLVEFGYTKVIVCASVENVKPKWMPKDEISGWISAEYSLLPSSTNVRCQRERTKLSGRTQEIQRLIGRSIRACVNLEKLGERTITIDADVIQADGGTRVASICGAYVALTELINKLLKSGELTENPIIEPIAAISVGIKDGVVLADLCYSEDSTTDVDANVVMTQSGKIIEFQATAEGQTFTREQLDKMYDVAQNAIQKIIKMY